MVLNSLVYIAVIIIVVILIIVLLRFLLGVIAIAPAVYGQLPQEQKQDDAGSTTIETNDTEIHIQCTENIEGLVAKCG